MGIIKYYFNLLLKVDKRRLFEFLSILIGEPSILTRKRRYIFILGHMRSYSSLLSHILGSHPQIDGNSEQHLHYKSRLDLIRLCVALKQELEEPLRGDIALDKLLHNGALSPSILKLPKIQFLILIREPRETLASHFRMQESKVYGASWQGCSSYYRSRLERLATVAKELRDRASFLKAEDLLERTDSVLLALQKKFALSGPLSETFQSFPQTGKAGSGDQSNWINEGRIIRNRSQKSLEIPHQVLSECESTYRTTMDILEKYSRRI